HGGAEVRDGRLVGEGRLRPEVRDGQGPLERPGRGQNFAPDRGQVVGGERSAVLRGQRPQDLSFPLRNIRRRPLPSFEVADLKGGLGALVERLRIWLSRSLILDRQSARSIG